MHRAIPPLLQMALCLNKHTDATFSLVLGYSHKKAISKLTKSQTSVNSMVTDYMLRMPVSSSFHDKNTPLWPMFLQQLKAWMCKGSANKLMRKFMFFYVLLTVHLEAILGNDQLDALFLNVFILCLYMFWAASAHHQEVQIVLIRHLV
jgi:hypothetical protein